MLNPVNEILVVRLQQNESHFGSGAVIRSFFVSCFHFISFRFIINEVNERRRTESRISSQGNSWKEGIEW